MKGKRRDPGDHFIQFWGQLAHVFIYLQNMVSLIMRSNLLSLASCSVAKLCPTLFDPLDCSMPDFPVLHIAQSLLKLRSFESVMPSNHLILCHPLLLLLLSIHSNSRHISLFYFSFIKLKMSYPQFLPAAHVLQISVFYMNNAEKYFVSK